MAKSGSTSTVAAAYLFGEPRYDIAATGIMPAPTAYNPFRMWVGGVYVPVKVQRWNGSVYAPII